MVTITHYLCLANLCYREENPSSAEPLLTDSPIASLGCSPVSSPVHSHRSSPAPSLFTACDQLSPSPESDVVYVRTTSMEVSVFHDFNQEKLINFRLSRHQLNRSFFKQQFSRAWTPHLLAMSTGAHKCVDLNFFQGYYFYCSSKPASCGDLAAEINVVQTGLFHGSDDSPLNFFIRREFLLVDNNEGG